MQKNYLRSELRTQLKLGQIFPSMSFCRKLFNFSRNELFLQSFNDSITNSSFSDFGKFGGDLDSSTGTLDESNKVNSSGSFLSEDRSPRNSPGGITIQPINYVSFLHKFI